MVIIDYNKINSVEKYFGEVMLIDDLTRSSRIKVKIATVFDDIPVEYMPWCYPRFLDGAESDMPAIGDIVSVSFMDNDLMYPLWYRFKTNENLSEISNSDYPNSTIVKEKDLSKFGLDGRLSIRYTPSEGIVVELKRANNKSVLNIRHDNSIIITNAKSKQSIHLSDDNISIGRETKSQQPAVVGNDNHEALKKLNAEIKSLSELMDSNLQALGAAAGASSYTKHLQPLFKSYGKAVKSTVKSAYNANNSFFPETLSKVVTVDKTKP